MPFIFDPCGHPRSNLTVPIESPWVLHMSAFWGPTLHVSLFSRYFGSKFWRWPLTPSGSSKVKFYGANRKPMGTFVYDLCWVQHRISHRLATNHPCDHPPNQPTNHRTKDIATTCVLQYYVLQPGSKNDHRQVDMESSMCVSPPLFDHIIWSGHDLWSQDLISYYLFPSAPLL